MRSVVVVLPASMWAMMPIFLILSSPTVRAIKSNFAAKFLPPVVREGSVGLGHAVYVVLFLNRSAAHVGGVVQFIRKFFRHALVGAAACILQDPANRKTRPAV